MEGRALRQASPSKEVVWGSAPRRRTGERGRAFPRTACMQQCDHQNCMGPPETGDIPKVYIEKSLYSSVRRAHEYIFLRKSGSL